MKNLLIKSRMQIKIATIGLSVFYGNFEAVKNVSLKIGKNLITAIIGPSGCGKSTLLRAFNRMNDFIPDTRTVGDVLIDGVSIYRNNINLAELRRKVGMVLQRPNPFPLSIYENVSYGLKIRGIKKKRILDEAVEKSLLATGLWDELKDKLHSSALSLTLEQQQRLCISRLISAEPEVLIMDEPCSALDPISTAKIEELLKRLKEKYAIIIVTHNIQQAARISDYAGFMLLGELIEFGLTTKLFTSPKDKRTENYITGKFG